MLVSRPGHAEAVLASLSSGIVAVDAQGLVSLINEDARRILGLSRPLGEALGHDCRSVLAGQPGVARLLVESLHGRAPLSRAELVLDEAADPAPRTIGFTLTPLRDGRRVVGAAMVFRDLTDFERSDEQERLRERLAALGQMAAGLAHEIRNPLAGMEVLAGLLKRRLGGRAEEEELVTELIGELRRLAETVSASLEYVRPPTLECGPVDPVALIEEALTTALSRVDFPGEIERCYDGRLPELTADAEQLGVVLTNLILNALEAMASSPSAEGHRLGLALRSHVADRVGRSIRVGREDDLYAGPSREVLITVSDTGPGVPPELRERVFYPFFTTKDSGSGVGLAAAQRIVAGHGGVIELESREGEGAAFRLRLPDRGAAR